MLCSRQPNPTFEVNSPRVRQRNRRQLSTEAESYRAQLRERSGQQDIIATVNQRSGEESCVRAAARCCEHYYDPESFDFASMRRDGFWQLALVRH